MRKRTLAGSAILVFLTASAPLQARRTELLFNTNWRFFRGDPEGGAQQPDFDDTGWLSVRLPHDWAIAGPFNPRENGYAGKLPWRGTGWYRKRFEVAEADRGKRVYFEFDGVMAFPTVYINGQLAGQWDYGYLSFRVDATPYVKFGSPNVIAVRADTRNHGTRWYPGAGICRKVVLTLCDPVHVDHWGTFVTTPSVKSAEAQIQVQTTIRSHLPAGVTVTAAVTISDPQGKPVAHGQRDVSVPAGKSEEVEFTLPVANPQRWDITSPRLYSARLHLARASRRIDTDIVPFGIRVFRFTANDGFHLNGRRVQLFGVNLHHDHGPIGAAFNTRAMERQLEIMKDMGCNAIRTSHNPPAPELLEPFQADSRKLFFGKAMLILRAREGEEGKIRVTARAQNLKEATVGLETRTR